MSKPLAIVLFAGLHGWEEGLVAAGWDCIGFDIEDICGKFGMPRPDGVHLVLQDVMTLCGFQFRSADLICASPPCTEYSYRAMPWKRAKALPPPSNRLFNTCFQLQREACAAAGRYIPMVVENVRGAQKWVGQARAHWGSYYLWGDVPALMPRPVQGTKVSGLNWSKFGQPDYKSSGAAGCFRDSAIKNTGGSWFRVAHNTTSGNGQNPDGRPLHSPHFTNPSEHPMAASSGMKRKLASAVIAKIPFELAYYIGRTFMRRAVAA